MNTLDQAVVQLDDNLLARNVKPLHKLLQKILFTYSSQICEHAQNILIFESLAQQMKDILL